MSRSYGAVVALDGVDLALEPGEICGLLGPNGAGKTTLVSIIAGLRTADAGSAIVGGVDALARPQDARRLLGLAPQELGVYPTATVRENLSLFAELAGLSGRDAAKAIDEVAIALELTDLLDRLVRTLSGGEKRRVHTAMAMLHRPRLLLLDEPTAGVDVSTRNRLVEAVRRLAAEQGTTIVYSTHYLPEVEALDASVAIIDHGRIVARGTRAELVRRYGDAAVELVFAGEPPAIDALVGVDGRAVECVVHGHTLRVPAEDPPSSAAELLVRLGPAAADIEAIELMSPSLESVFLAVTGRRYESDGSDPVISESVNSGGGDREPDRG